MRRIFPMAGGEGFAELEWMNPFGSIKDRAARPTLPGLPCTITTPSGAPEEKMAILKLLGAEIWPTPDDLCPVDHPKDGAIALARTFVTAEATRNLYVMPN